MEIINNPWTTGIGGGIISGLIIYFITSRLLSEKQNKEYSQKITTANNELLYTMRPLVVKKQIPSKEIVNSIIESTARKHEVNKTDLYNLTMLVDDLTREVMENAFLNSEQKIDFCNKINELKIENETPMELKLISEKVIYQTDHISSQFVSFLFASTIFFGVLLANLFTTIKDSFVIKIGNRLDIVTLILVGVLAPIFAILLSTFINLFVKKYKEKR